MSKKQALKALESIYNRAISQPRYNDQTSPYAALTGIEALSNGIKNTVVDCKNESTRKEA